MRRTLAILVFGLAACTAPAANNISSADPSAPAAGNAASAKPEAAGGNAAGTPADETAGLARFRAEWLEACIGGGRDAAPAGTPVDRHCACAIDRVMAGQSLAELEEGQASGSYRSRFTSEMRACIREIPR